MQTKGTRQGKAFRVTALADQILHLVPVADGNGGLLNDRAVIQIFGDVVSSSTDELDPTVPGTVIRLSTLERWQKRMVDVCLLYTSPSPRD